MAPSAQHPPHGQSQHGQDQHGQTQDRRSHGASRSAEHVHGTEHSHGDESGMADMLDLDAEVLASQLAKVIDWAGQLGSGTPGRIADVGAGTGTGSLALARRFAEAEIVALDVSPGMLERLVASSIEQGLAERMSTVQADLDAAWPEAGRFDLVWAASSLHHFAEVDRVLRDILTALNPGGLFVAVEMDGFPRVLPDDLGFGRPGLETRLHDVIARRGWNAHPDWQVNLASAGFEMIERRVFTADLNPAPPITGRYAHAFLSRVRTGLTDELAADDLAALDRLLVVDGPDSVLQRGDLTVRSSRTAWAARRATERPTA